MYLHFSFPSAEEECADSRRELGIILGREPQKKDQSMGGGTGREGSGSIKNSATISPRVGGGALCHCRYVSQTTIVTFQ